MFAIRDISLKSVRYTSRTHKCLIDFSQMLDVFLRHTVAGYSARICGLYGLQLQAL